ncbi:hypothetical protein P9112_007518 [Eukaryota sp. TZLM1-RC]
MHRGTIILVLLSCVSAELYSSVTYLDVPSVSNRIPCSSARIKFENVQVLRDNNEISIVFHRPKNSNITVDEALLQTISTGCCYKRGAKLSPIKLYYSSIPITRPFSFSEPLFIANVVHAKNIFHIIVDTLLSIHWTFEKEGIDKARFMWQYCPISRTIPSVYSPLFAPYTTEFVDYPISATVETVYIDLDRAPYRCKADPIHKHKKGSFLEECPKLIERFKARLFGFHNITTTQSKTKKAVLIDRAPYNRQLVSIKSKGWVLQLQQFFKQNNWDLNIIRFSDLDIVEQIRAVSNANLLVGVHGAGMAHLLWMPESSGVFVLYPSGCINYVYNFLAETLGHFHLSHDVSLADTLFSTSSKISGQDFQALEFSDSFLRLNDDTCFFHWKEASIHLKSSKLISLLKPLVKEISSV